MDKIDMRILSHLINDCRESDRQIGMDVGISGSAVASRIKKLEESGVIGGYTIKIEPPMLGYGIFYVVISGSEIGEKMEQIKLVGEPFFIVPCVGGITVCGIVVKDDIQKRIALAKEIMSGARILTIFEAQTESAGPHNLTRTDLAIIESLLADPRKKVEGVSRETGLSAKTVARSLTKLSDNEGVQFMAMYDPSALESYIPYVVLAWVSGDTRGIKGELDRQFGHTYMQVPFLTKNQIVLFMYADSIFKLDEITQRIRNISGVDSIDTFIPKKISFPHSWVKDAIGAAKKSPRFHLTYQTS